MAFQKFCPRCGKTVRFGGYDEDHAGRYMAVNCPECKRPLGYVRHRDG